MMTKSGENLDKNERVLVLDLFSGIGGLTEALTKAGAHWELVVFVESDKDCRRLLRRKYPGAIFINDVKELDRKMLRKLLDKVPGVTGLIVGGGSPCQGLSRLSSLREHLADERSALFFEASRIFKEVESLAASLQIWVLKLLENVVPDSSDIKVMNQELGMKPVPVDAQYLSRARRPRLIWLSCPLSAQDDVEVIEWEAYDQVVYRADPEPLEHFLAAGLADPRMRFPTFTRSIPRQRPPPSPVGLNSASPAAKARWETDQFRYPPYTYRDDFMILSKERELRPLRANEREVLMGFERGHTKCSGSLQKQKRKKERQKT